MPEPERDLLDRISAEPNPTGGASSEPRPSTEDSQHRPTKPGDESRRLRCPDFEHTRSPPRRQRGLTVVVGPRRRCDPGKLPLVPAIPNDGAIVQQRAAVTAAEPGGSPDGAAVAAAADHGTSGSAGGLPYREQIQQLFGRHDISCRSVPTRVRPRPRVPAGNARLGLRTR